MRHAKLFQEIDWLGLVLQVTHRKFLDGEWDTVQNALSAERARPAYKLSIRYEQPGIFYLAFVLRTTPARENFSVLPSGYYYRKKVIRTA